MFTSTNGAPLDVDAFGQSVPRICKEIGLGHWSIHELRHSCASLMLHEEVPLEVVSEAMGHSSIRMTKDVYGHLMPRSREKAAKAMDVVLFGAERAGDRADPAASEPLAANVAANEGSDDPEEGEKQPLIRGSVRPSGFEPETCGLRVRCSAVELEARGDPTPRASNTQRWIDFTSTNSSNPNAPRSRPIPDCL